MSRSTWACELKYTDSTNYYNAGVSRSTWACELKFQACYMALSTTSSRSTWACELKCSCQRRRDTCPCHAPRERVSWNSKGVYHRLKMVVTLHVSVWVEIGEAGVLDYLSLVTLHVSVWVEIRHRLWLQFQWGSRSTWACELKLAQKGYKVFRLSSRSTWACELKYTSLKRVITLISHAPRERVSWNVKSILATFSIIVTLHVSVWVEISFVSAVFHVLKSRSTWACELKWHYRSKTWWQ